MSDAAKVPTLDEIRIMPAGREMDALIERLISGRDVGCIHDAPRDREGSNHRTCVKCGEEFGDTTYAMAMNRWPDYSTGITAAMALATAIGGLTLGHYRAGDGQPAAWEACFDLGDGSYTGFFTAETAPLAISRAALASRSTSRLLKEET